MRKGQAKKLQEQEEIRRKVGLLIVWVLWRIKLCRLFNAKFCLYVYTLSLRFLNTYLVGKIFDK